VRRSDEAPDSPRSSSITTVGKAALKLCGLTAVLDLLQRRLSNINDGKLIEMKAVDLFGQAAG
jgi:hypothetical protein